MRSAAQGFDARAAAGPAVDFCMARALHRSGSRKKGFVNMAEEDARAVEGILLGAGLGAVFWTIIAAVAAST